MIFLNLTYPSTMNHSFTVEKYIEAKNSGIYGFELNEQQTLLSAWRLFRNKYLEFSGCLYFENCGFDIQHRGTCYGVESADGENNYHTHPMSDPLPSVSDLRSSLHKDGYTYIIGERFVARYRQGSYLKSVICKIKKDCRFYFQTIDEILSSKQFSPESMECLYLVKYGMIISIIDMESLTQSI